jgi:hypothetical protein
VHTYLQADTAPDVAEFATHPRLTPDREAVIRTATAGADPRETVLPAWMAQSLLAEVDALRQNN